MAGKGTDVHTKLFIDLIDLLHDCRELGDEENAEVPHTYSWDQATTSRKEIKPTKTHKTQLTRLNWKRWGKSTDEENKRQHDLKHQNIH